MDKLCTLTERQARDLFPRALQKLDGLPGNCGTCPFLNTVFAIVMDGSRCKLATWEQQPCDPPQGVLLWEEKFDQWDY